MMELLQKISLYFLLALLSIGCSKKLNDDVISFGIAQKPQQLDPRFQSDAASKKLSHLIYTPFIYLDENFLPRSDVVTFKKNNDLQYFFRLNKSLPVFKGGKVMDIHDIINTLRDLKNLSTSTYFQQLRNIRSIEKKSNTIFYINLF